MGGPDVPTPTIDPATREVQLQAQRDRIDSIRDRVSSDTRNTLIQFGRSKALSGAGDLGGGLGNLSDIGGSQTPGLMDLLSGPGPLAGGRVSFLRALGKL